MPRMLLGLALLILAGLWWRWAWLPPSDLALVHVQLRLPEQEHPLDALLRRHLASLSASPKLLAQLRRRQSPYLLANLQVDACEVTQGQFRRFANWRAAQLRPPLAHWSTPPGWNFHSQTQDHRLLGQLPLAAGGLSFHDAWAYCHAAGGRLPTAAEFEAIAAGAGQRLYPWGQAFEPSAWPHADPSLNIAQACGAHPATSTPEGLHELGSSLLEWTRDETGQPTLMGGNAWHRPRRLQALSFIRRPAAADFRSAYTGFRCVYDEPAPRRLGQVRAAGISRSLPWGGASQTRQVAGGERQLGPPAGSRILPLLQSLEDETVGVLKHLPILPSALDLRVMRHEVSRAQYARFLRDPLVRLGFFDHPKQPAYIRHQPDDWAQQMQAPEHPVTRVSWWSAAAFARWAGGALPSAEEWQLIAGASLQRFPYGNDYEPGRAVDRNYSVAQPPPGASQPAPPGSSQPAAAGASQPAAPGASQPAAPGASQPVAVGASQPAATGADGSAHGIIGFGGNVAEWTSTSVLRGNAFNLVIKGGSYLMPAAGSQVAQTSEAVPDYRSADLGFRLVFR